MRILASMILAYSGGGLREALAHAPALHPSEGSGLLWSFEPWVVLPLGLLAAFYVTGMLRLWPRINTGAGLQRRRALLFAAGWLASAVALLSPLDGLSDELFTFHMLQHEVLMLVAAPFLVLAAPGAAFAWALPESLRRPVTTGFSGLRPLWQLLTLPLLAWALQALVLWSWHLPALFQAAVRSELVHALQHLSFFLAAVIFWPSLVAGRAGEGVSVISLFTTAVHSSLLGALLVFAPIVWYVSYLESAGHWGLTPLEDQQLGGLIMWVPGGAVYLLAALWLLARWLDRAERSVRRHEARRTSF